MSHIDDVKEFHKKFEIPMAERPSVMHPTMARFRVNFMQEELDEFVEAYDKGDVAVMVDSLIDLVYVALGTALIMGVSEGQWQRCWDIVQLANMAKVRGVSGRSSYDVVKPEGWTDPLPALKHILGC